MVKKYAYYQCVTEFDTENSEDYRAAFAAYHSHQGSATLYGVDNMGNFSTIFTK